MFSPQPLYAAVAPAVLQRNALCQPQLAKTAGTHFTYTWYLALCSHIFTASSSERALTLSSEEMTASASRGRTQMCYCHFMAMLTLVSTGTDAAQSTTNCSS